MGYGAGVRRKLALAGGVLALVTASGGAAAAAVTLSTPSGPQAAHAATVSAPAHPQKPLLAVVGASFSAGVGAGQPDRAWPEDLARPLRALFIPGEHAVDAHRLLRKLDSALENGGGRIVDAQALARI